MTQHTVCKLQNILPETGVCALIDGKQIAIFRTKEDKLFAIDNYDPFSQANVLSRGLIGGTTLTNDEGDKESILYVASPIYKQRFNLVTGECLDDTEVKLATYHVERDEDDVVVTYQLSEDSSLTTIEIDMA